MEATMPLEYADVTFGFMTDPQAYACSVPDSVDTSTPQVTATVALAGTARDIVYHPRLNGAGGPDTIRRATRRPNGVEVNIFQPKVDPPRLIAVWRFPEGLLSTWMPLPDAANPDEPVPGAAGLDQVIAALTVTFANGYPLVQSRDPNVTVDGPKASNERDTTSFIAKDGWPTVQFSKLPRASARGARASNVTQAPDFDGPPDRFTDLSVDTRYGVRVRVVGPLSEADTLEEALLETAGSLKPM
jgi:hypothetical protein